MDKVEKQQQQNQSLPSNGQYQMKDNPIPELVNQSSKQAPIFYDANEVRQKSMNDSHRAKQLQNIEQDKQKPEQLCKQIAYNENNGENIHEQNEDSTLNNKGIIIDKRNEDTWNKVNNIINESQNNQNQQVHLPIQNQNSHQELSEFSIPLQTEQQRQINYNQPQKIQQVGEKKEEIYKQSYSQEEKQKIRLNTQLMQSSFNDKDKPIVEFQQYNQNIATLNQQSLPKAASEQPSIKNNQKLSNGQKLSQNKQEVILPKFEPSFLTSIQNSPRKEGAGKIARKKMHEKVIYDALLTLQKRDKKPNQIYELAQKRELSSHKIDLSKLQTNITLNSKVINVTVIEPQQQKTQQQKLLLQVQLLRKKLLHLQISKNKQKEYSIASNQSLSPLFHKQEYIHLQNMSHQESSEGDYFISSKHDRRRNIGKFYRLVENNNANISEGLRNLGFRGQSEFQKQTFSARKAKTNSFRVRKNNKSNYLSHDKDQSIEQIPQNDECFQIKREVTEKLLFDQEDKLNFIQKPTPRNLIFEQNFKEYIQSFFVYEILGKPTKNDSESELVQLAKITFNKFGINIKQDKSKALNVRKYKNCVSFIVDSFYTIIWHYEGRFYLGGWEVDENGDGNKVGWGYENSTNKFTYSGQFKDNKRDGYGIMRIYCKNSEIIYEGQWKEGMKHGLGKQLQADSSIYVGEWQNGKKQGQGKMINSESDEYEGQFKNGLKWGKGKQKFKNKDSYVGEYSQGKFHGKGTYTWSNFSRYEGSFVEGKRCGHGIWASDYRNPKTDSYQGQYLNDKKHGFGRYHWKDGTIYEGEFQNDVKHGEGIITQPNGRVVRLDWIEGNIVSKKDSKGIDESGAVTYKSKNQPFKNKQQKDSERSIKSLKVNLRGNRKSNALIST